MGADDLPTTRRAISRRLDAIDDDDDDARARTTTARSTADATGSRRPVSPRGRRIGAFIVHVHAYVATWRLVSGDEQTYG